MLHYNLKISAVVKAKRNAFHIGCSKSYPRYGIDNVNSAASKTRRKAILLTFGPK